MLFFVLFAAGSFLIQGKTKRDIIGRRIYKTFILSGEIKHASRFKALDGHIYLSKVHRCYKIYAC
jgi:hypothetical protein